jgi:hypothetical protein
MHCASGGRNVKLGNCCWYVGGGPPTSSMQGIDFFFFHTGASSSRPRKTIMDDINVYWKLRARC